MTRRVKVYDYTVDDTPAPPASCAGRTRGRPGAALLRTARCRSPAPACCGAVCAGSGRMTGVWTGESPRPPEASLHCSPARDRAVPMAAVQAGRTPINGGAASLFAGQWAGRFLRLSSVWGARRTPTAGGVLPTPAGQWAGSALPTYCVAYARPGRDSGSGDSGRVGPGRRAVARL